MVPEGALGEEAEASPLATPQPLGRSRGLSPSPTIASDAAPWAFSGTLFAFFTLS